MLGADSRTSTGAYTWRQDFNKHMVCICMWWCGRLGAAKKGAARKVEGKVMPLRTAPLNRHVVPSGALIHPSSLLSTCGATCRDVRGEPRERQADAAPPQHLLLPVGVRR